MYHSQLTPQAHELNITRLTLVEIIYDLVCPVIDVHDTKRNI